MLSYQEVEDNLEFGRIGSLSEDVIMEILQYFYMGRYPYKETYSRGDVLSLLRDVLVCAFDFIDEEGFNTCTHCCECIRVLSWILEDRIDVVGDDPASKSRYFREIDKRYGLRIWGKQIFLF